MSLLKYSYVLTIYQNLKSFLIAMSAPSSFIIDKGHVHNHIFYNSIAFDRSRKFHNFIDSRFAVRRLSDRVCIEHELSVIQNPKQHNKSPFLHYGQWIGKKPPSAQQRVRLAIVEALGKKPADFPVFLRLMEESGVHVKHGRGGVISFLASGQDKYTRLRASVLGPGFDPDDIQTVIAGERPIPELLKNGPAPPRHVNLIIDIQERMAQGKGLAYARWAKVYNLKQMAAALQYLQEHNREAVINLNKGGFTVRLTVQELSRPANEIVIPVMLAVYLNQGTLTEARSLLFLRELLAARAGLLSPPSAH